MRRNCASNASNEHPNATNTRPARMASAQGMERRTTKAAGSKFSCAVRFTCAEGGAPSLETSLKPFAAPAGFQAALLVSRDGLVVASEIADAPSREEKIGVALSTLARTSGEALERLGFGAFEGGILESAGGGRLFLKNAPDGTLGIFAKAEAKPGLVEREIDRWGTHA